MPCFLSPVRSPLFLIISLLIWVVHSPVLDTATLGCRALWKGMCSPASSSALLEFKQAVVFCLLGPGKLVPPR